MKPAARRRVERTGYFSSDRDAGSAAHVDVGNGIEQHACIGVARLGEQLVPGGEFDDPAGDSGIARANAADLKRLLPAMPVTLLPHGASGFDPLLDWWALAGGLS